MKHHTLAQIPFEGFYDSRYSAAIDYEESQWLEWKTSESEYEKDNSDHESYWPEALRIDSPDLGQILFHNCRYGDAYRALAAVYVDTFSYVVGEALQITRNERQKRYDWTRKKSVTEWRKVESLGLKYESMDSPREYNFTTDRVYAWIPNSVIKTLWARHKADKFATLRAMVKEQHSSRDGFISFYENDLDEWPKSPLDFDHNQMQTLLLASMKLAGCDYDDSELSWSIYESAMESNSAYNAWSNCVDWRAFESARMESRAEKLAEWLESDHDSAMAWRVSHSADCDSVIAADPGLFAEWDSELESMPVRCDKTLDLFADTGRA